MRCPRCGADNADRAQRCYLCEYPFATSGAEGEPPSPEEHVQPQYPPPGAQGGLTPPGPQAGPPPPMTGTGYQAAAPGAYPAGYQPPPPAAKGPLNVKVIIGVLVVLLVVIVGVAAFFFLQGKTYNINVPPPPGYKEADQEMVDELKDTMSEGSEDIEIDEIYIDDSTTNFVIVASMDIPPSLGSDTPSGEDPEEMEEWFYDNKGEWVEAFNTGLVQGAGGLGASAGIDLYEVERLVSGDAALHIATTIDLGQASFIVDTLWIIKGDSAFFVVVEGLNPGAKTLESLKESITFEEK